MLVPINIYGVFWILCTLMITLYLAVIDRRGWEAANKSLNETIRHYTIITTSLRRQLTTAERLNKDAVESIDTFTHADLPEPPTLVQPKRKRVVKSTVPRTAESE
jgi:hypothetical protein